MHPLQTRQERKPLGRVILAAISVASVVTACVIPLPRLDPPEISDEQLVPIEIGKTTPAKVEAALGKPDIIWETERIWIYEEGPSGHILLVVGMGGARLMDLGEDVVIMRFDEEGRIERLDRRTGPLSRHDYGDFLRAWLAEQGDETGSNSKP